MASRPEQDRGGIRSSIVLRLNLRLFLRLLGIYLTTDLLLLALSWGGLLLWCDRQCGEIAQLVAERGVPSAEATAWMSAGDYTISALEAPPPEYGLRIGGFLLPMVLGPQALPEEEEALRVLTLGEESLFFGLWTAHPGRGAAYTLSLPNAGTPYAITLALEQPVDLMAFAGRVLLVCQLFSLLLNLLRNAGLIKKTLRPIQELAAAATRLGSAPPSMSASELSALAGRLDEINATHLDKRIPVSGTQKELRDLAQAINAMLDRLGAAYRAQMRFDSDASHELRTPIAVIQGYASLLDRWGKDDPATRQEAIDAIRGEAESMKELVEQLLFLARGDNDTMQVELANFDLTEVAAQVFKETEMIDQTHPFTARWGRIPVPVHADLGLIKQCVRVLVDNSIKYTPDGGEITLSLETAGNTARLSVQDEGDGIDAERLPHIFERFYRADQSRDRKTGGTGLGLAIAQTIAERHGGWLEVLSRRGVGTRMTLVLPLASLPGGEG